jgi:hypothetical protein
MSCVCRGSESFLSKILAFTSFKSGLANEFLETLMIPIDQGGEDPADSPERIRATSVMHQNVKEARQPFSWSEIRR